MVNWRDQAACIGLDPELFFPIGASGPTLLQVEEAKAVCARCPVVAECLDRAIHGHEAFGVWGGMDEGERRTYIRQGGMRNHVKAMA